MNNNNHKVRIATVWLDGCSGCHMSFLDLDEALLSLIDRIDLVWGPLVDTQEFPNDVDVTLVEGAVASQDDLKKIQTVRARSRVVVAMGDCAVTSNVSSMRNNIPIIRLLQRVYVDGVDINKGAPTTGVPALFPQARPIQDFVTVDVYLPGCPPKPGAILAVIQSVLEGKKAAIPSIKFG